MKVEFTLTWNILRTWSLVGIGMKLRGIFPVSQMSETTGTQPRFILKSESRIFLRHLTSKLVMLFCLSHVNNTLDLVSTQTTGWFFCSNDRGKAFGILMKNLKAFAPGHEELFKEMTLLLIFDDIRYDLINSSVFRCDNYRWSLSHCDDTTDNMNHFPDMEIQSLQGQCWWMNSRKLSRQILFSVANWSFLASKVRGCAVSLIKGNICNQFLRKWKKNWI